jgi:putative colanic acid biosynthesis acetyltransferase WcaF
MKIDLRRSVTKWSTREKIRRGLFTYIFWPLVKHLPKKASYARVLMLRIFGAKIGCDCLIESGVAVWIPWRLHLWSHVAIGRNVEIYNYDWVRIKPMTVISQYTYLCTGTHDYTHPHMPLRWRPIDIGSECWIAANVFIAPGVAVGDGTVVGACSVVTRSLPSWTVCAGNPCVVIKPRVINDQ